MVYLVSTLAEQSLQFHGYVTQPLKAQVQYVDTQQFCFALFVVVHHNPMLNGYPNSAKVQPSPR
jgi:hypothetical protein